MSTSKTKYAIDLSNEGVALWHRDEKQAWVLLGKVALDAPNFSDDMEKLKNGHDDGGTGTLLAKVRIPRSEVFASEIKLDVSAAGDVQSKVADFLTEKTPYKADDLFFDLDHKGSSGKSYIAAVTKETINEAKSFITGYGFEAAYYTTKFDKADFPRDARFYDGKPPTPIAVEPIAPAPEKVKAEAPQDKPKLDDIPTPPPPKPIAEKSKVVDEKKTTDEKPSEIQEETTLVEDTSEALVEKTDFSSFETVRSKTLVAPNKNGSKKEPSVSKHAPPPPPRRLSISVPNLEASSKPGAKKELTAGVPRKTHVAPPKKSVKDVLKPRHYLILIALLLIALGYWFVTTLFDGKEEIARLNELPAPEVVVSEPEENVQSDPENTLVDVAPTLQADVAEITNETPEPSAIEDLVPEEQPDQVVVEAEQTPEENDVDVASPEPSEADAPETINTVEEDTTPAIEAPIEVADVPSELENEQALPNDVASVTEPIEDAVTTAPEQTSDVAEPETQTAEITEPEVTPTEEPATEQLADLIPTKDGTLGAEGITLFAGVPDITPPLREQLKISPDPLKDILPKMRSADFAEIHKAEIDAVKAEAAEEIVEVEATEAITELEVAETVETETAPTDTETTPAGPDLLALADPALKSIQPRQRPSAIIATRVKEIAAAALPPADPELANLKPRQRPRNLAILKPAVQPQQVDPSEIQVAIQEAVRDIARPRARPARLSRTIANQKAAEKASERKEAVQTAALTPRTARGTSKASSPTANSVQRQATERGGINKRRISLIGVYGKSSNRRALVRMPSGRYVKVQPGQSFNGWKVAAIGESSVRITKGSRNQVLRMPKN